MLSIRSTPQVEGHKQVKSAKMEKIYRANMNQKKTGMAILISDEEIAEQRMTPVIKKVISQRLRSHFIK